MLQDGTIIMALSFYFRDIYPEFAEYLTNTMPHASFVCVQSSDTTYFLLIRVSISYAKPVLGTWLLDGKEDPEGGVPTADPFYLPPGGSPEREIMKCSLCVLPCVGVCVRWCVTQIALKLLQLQIFFSNKSPNEF